MFKLEINSPVLTDKIAGFDYDQTLVHPQNGRPFPKDVNDWQLNYDNIPDVLKSYHNDGYTIVIFTNQSKEWKKEQIKNVAETFNIPIFVMIAMEKTLHKPNPLMFTQLIGDNLIDKENSFFIGDALGRKGDFSDSDKVFAQNIGIKVIAPEIFFAIDNENVIVYPDIPIVDDPEMVIMVGYPGSGKSTFANTIFGERGYGVIGGDEYKTIAKMKKKAKEYIEQNKSIVFDATNSSKKKRAEYIEFAEKNDYSVRCIHVTTSFDESYKRNKTRADDEQVPKIAYNVYRKHFEDPDEEEGFVLINI